MPRKAFKYRLSPTPKQEQHLLFVLRCCRELYNSGLEQRKAFYQMRRKSLGYTQQAAELAGIKMAYPAYQDIYSSQHKDFQYKAVRALVHRFGLIVFEDLKIINMSAALEPKPDPEKDGAYLPNGASAKAGLNTSLLDAGWGQFQQYCVAKAASAGRRVLFVDPKNTSQRCSGCGQVVHKELEERWHSCECGCSLDRDHNAALNILFRGQEVAHRLTGL